MGSSGHFSESMLSREDPERRNKNNLKQLSGQISLGTFGSLRPDAPGLERLSHSSDHGKQTIWRAHVYTILVGSERASCCHSCAQLEFAHSRASSCEATRLQSACGFKPLLPHSLVKDRKKKGINIKNLGRKPPLLDPPPQGTPDPANSLCLGPLFPSQYRKKVYIKNFGGGVLGGRKILYAEFLRVLFCT